MKKKRVTMKDVAQALGVHHTTVSLALRNHASLPPKTRELVKLKAKELGYVPDPMLSALVSYRRTTKESKAPPTIAYILDLKDEKELKKFQCRWLFFINAVERAKELGYKLEVFYYGSGNYNSRTLDRIFRTRQITGIIIAAFTHKTDLKLTWDNYSVVKIEALPTNLTFDMVENNQMQVAQLAMQKMHEKGYKRVGMFVGEHDELHTRNLFSAGYLVSQNLFAPEDRVPLKVIKGINLEHELDDIIDWLDTYKVETLITNWNELIPYIDLIKEKLGRDFLFVSLDIDHFNSEIMGIRQNHEMVGKNAVDSITTLMRTNKRGEQEHPTTHLVDSCWQEAPTLKAISF